MKSYKKWLAAFIIVAAVLVWFFFFLSGRSSSRQTIVVATDSDTAPYTFKKKGKFDGYDIALVKAIFKDSKDYKVSFETVAFSSIMTGIDSGRFQMSANNFNYSKERAEKYLFSNPISKSNYAIASKEGRYKTLDDLSGKSVEVYTGSNYAAVLENWNKRNRDKKPIVIKYVANTVTLAQRLQHVEDGRTDALLYDAISLKTVIKDQNITLKVTTVKGNIGDKRDGLEYLLLANDKTGKALQKYINSRVKELRKNGTLKKLSQRYFAGDYVSTLD